MPKHERTTNIRAGYCVEHLYDNGCFRRDTSGSDVDDGLGRSVLLARIECIDDANALFEFERHAFCSFLSREDKNAIGDVRYVRILRRFFEQ